MALKQLTLGDLSTNDVVALMHQRHEKRQARRDKESPEEVFAFQCRAHKLPAFTRQAQFAKQALGRRWQFDFCFDEYKLAVEIEGLVVLRDKRSGELMVKGRHASITGFKEDCIKYASAIVLGWTVLRFEQSQVKDGTAIDYTMRALHARGWRS